MFLADIFTTQGGQLHRKAVVLEAGEPDDPVLINEQLGWDNEWHIYRIAPTNDANLVVEANRKELENPDWIAVPPDVKLISDSDHRLRFPPLASNGMWLRAKDPRWEKGRVYVYFSRIAFWSVELDHSTVHDFSGKTYFLLGRWRCSDAPE